MFMAALPKIGNLLRDARRRAGLTQAELAQRLDTTQSAVARLESPRSNPRLLTLVRAMAATGQVLDVKLKPAPQAPVDESLIAENLDLDPAARLRRFADAYRTVSGLARKAQVVGS